MDATSRSASSRPYADIAARLTTSGDRASRMQAVVDALWDALHDKGVSWVGFYLHEGADELTLGPRRDKPACSPIGLHGACGKAFLSRQPLVVRDVAELGANYIACDPRDRSEVVIPVFDERGRCWGVLDVDSHEVGAFDERDVQGLRAVLAAAGL
ncbi:Free methionine-R-sulfoxide reductase [Phycisphaerae bacterium RAS1]|nr:Free methionine-R-sulfoxide reductase [Phycisphaerae bacterium RAS1]